MEALYWLILLIVLLVIEIITLGLTTLWFAGGALVAFIGAMAGTNLQVQIILFLLVSLVLLFGTRPIAVRYLNNNKIRTNVGSLVGKTALVLETIENQKGQGLVIVNDQKWIARAKYEEVIIEKDSVVNILHVNGQKLIVEEK